MKGNLKRDSSELQKRFHAAYKNFFNAHDIVLSGDNVLTWWADVSHGISSLRIKQKLPIKTFCWANLNASGKITFRKISHYSPVENTFKEDDFTAFFKHEAEGIALFLQNFLIKNGFSGGMEIDFLAEAPRWRGFAFSGVISTLLTYLLHIVIGKLDPKILKSWGLSADQHLFNELYLASLRLSHCISQGKSVGASNVYAVMLPDNPLPIAYFSKNNTPDRAGRDQDIDVETVVYKDTLANLLGVNAASVGELPLDYGVIFTGMEYTFSEVELAREWAKKGNDRLNVFIADIVRSMPIEDRDREALSHLLSFDKNETSRKNIDGTNLRLLDGFDRLLKNPWDDHAVNAFIDIAKNIGLVSFSYQKENRIFFAIQYLFYRYRKFEDEEIAILPFNTGKIGGSLLFVTKHRKSRATIEKVLEQLESEGYTAILDYASWRDGYSGDGVHLEQFTSQKIYSDYTKEGNVVFSDTSGTSYFGDYDAVIKEENGGILLDTIGGRIYVRGVKLTSKDIHSQNTTIDMMKILLENVGKEVSNTKLPVSTYSQNKNEILGKVVIPLRKLTKEHFWEEIPLVCSGGITDYYLRLDRNDSIRIGILKKAKN